MFSSEARLEWLLAFLQMDLATLRPGQLLDLRNDVFAFLHETTRATITVHDPDLRALKPARVEAADPIVALARDLLTRVQRELLAGVTALQTTGSWQPFGLLPTTPGPQWSFERRPDGTVGRAYCGGWKTITVAAAADLLVEWWPQLRRCAYDKCGVLFRPTHGRQHFHDPKCSALDRWFRLPKKKRDYKQELANANRRARRKTSRRRKTK